MSAPYPGPSQPGGYEPPGQHEQPGRNEQPGQYGRPPGPPQNRGQRRSQRELQKHRTREAQWAANRYAVPYPTDGPKVTMGIIWFGVVLSAMLLGVTSENSALSAVAVAVVLAVVAALAGLQAGFAWFRRVPSTRSWTAMAAGLTAIPGFYGPGGVAIGLALGIVTLIVYVVLYRGHRRPPIELFDVLARSSLPVGLAAACLAALAFRNLPAAIGLLFLISAYEAGDFIVGSGAFNPIEGPMAGATALAVVAFFLFLIEPDPFSSETILVFSVVAALGAPLGQYAASALLPHGASWAPALRRLDSYLLVAPIWLLLLVLLPDAH